MAGPLMGEVVDDAGAGSRAPDNDEQSREEKNRSVPTRRWTGSLEKNHGARPVSYHDSGCRARSLPQ